MIAEGTFPTTAPNWVAVHLWDHQSHVNTGTKDLGCAWCVYAAKLDHDRAFLRKVSPSMRPKVRAIEAIARPKT